MAYYELGALIFNYRQLIDSCLYEFLDDLIFVLIKSGVGDRCNEVMKHIDEIREEHEYGGFSLEVL